MHYLIYLATLGILLFMGAVTTIRIVPSFAVHIDFSNIINFLDIQSIIFVLLSVFLILYFTKSLRAVKDAVLFALGKRDAGRIHCEECILAVRTTMGGAVSAGTILFLMSVINMLKGMDLDAGVSRVGLHLSIGLLSLVYAGIIVLIMLPVYVHLKRSLLENKGYTQQKSEKRKNRR